MTQSPDAFKERIERALSLVAGNDPLGAIALLTSADDVGDHPESCAALAVAAFAMDDPGRAIQLLRRAHELAPDVADYADLLSGALTRVGKLEEGLYFSKLSVALAANPLGLDFNVTGLQNYFLALKATAQPPYYLKALTAFLARDWAETLRWADRELALNPDNSRCHVLLARTLMELGDHSAAVSALQVAVSLVPEEPMTYLYLADGLEGLGRFDEAKACRREALRLAPKSDELRVARLRALSRASTEDFQAFATLQEEHNASLLNKFEPSPPATGSGGESLVVGIISDRFHDGPLMNMVGPVIAALPRHGVKLVAYQQVPVEDVSAGSIQRAAETWRETFDIDDDTLEVIVRGDKVDVLLDLCGYSQTGRMGLLARHPAPVVAAWMGQPAAAGAAGVDLVLSDAATIEADEMHLRDGQDCLVLSNGLVSFLPFLEMGAPVPPPCLAEGALTFGTVLDLALLQPESAAAFARLLRALPNTRLRLGNLRRASEEVLLRAHGLFANYGVSDRILLQVAEDDRDVTEDFLNGIDVLLDSLPLSQPKLVARALWMGVPALGLMQGRRAGRLGASVLRAAGLQQWIAMDEDNLIDRARQLAARPEHLAGLRQTLRAQIQETALFQPDRLAAELAEKLASAVKARA